MRFRFGINTIAFLALILGTLLMWVGFEYYHQRNDVEIPEKLRQHAKTPLPNSFDNETLKTYYDNSKNNFYEPVDSSATE
jgi:hypothetical protein